MATSRCHVPLAQRDRFPDWATGHQMLFALHLGRDRSGGSVDFKDGKIAATWAMQDRLGLIEQVGAVVSRAENVHWAAGDDS